MAKRPSAFNPPPALSISEALQRANQHWNAGQADQAELFCQRVLSVWPGQPDALHLMGLMAHAYGNLDLGIQHLRQACLSPRVPAIYLSNLAEMCRQRGLLAEAEQAARQAVALEPGLVSAWNNLGIILQEMGQLGESATCLQRVVALQPDSPEAHNNLGNTLNRMRDLDRARQHYDRALALNPNYAEVHSNLAYLLNELGLIDRAVAAARHALDINPRLVDGYINLAAIELARHRPAEALRWIEALLAFAPSHAGALSVLSRILKRLDRFDEARDAALRAVASAPENGSAHNVLGEINQALNRTDEAFEAFATAARLPGPDRDQALVHRAVLTMELGRKEDALAQFEALLAENPHNVAAWANRADLKRFTLDDPDIAKMEALLAASGGQSLNDRTALHFALGKAYLDARQDDRAFRHFAEGNRMKRSTFSFDVKATGAWMRSIAMTVSDELLARMATGGAASDMPIFVLGMPRSGTSLVEQILASHPLVHGAGELGILESLVGSLGTYPAALETLSAIRLSELGEAYLARIRSLAQGRRHVVDKMPANFLHAGLIRMILPNARIVHCRRDPVDTCLSCYTKLFAGEQRFAYDLSELGQFHRHYQALTDHWRHVLPGDRFIELDYEALVADQEGETRRLLEALGLVWDPRCLDFHETVRVVRTASVVQVRQPIYKTAAGRWKAHAAHLAPLLAALGVAAP